MRKKLLWLTVVLMLATMALQICLIRAASETELLVDVLYVKEAVMPYEALETAMVGTIKVAEGSVQPEMLTAIGQLEGKKTVRGLRSGEILNQFDLTVEEDYEMGMIALRLDPQDAVGYDLEIGEAIDLLGVKGSESPIHFKTMTVKNILGQDLSGVEVSLMPPMYLILIGDKKEIFELCRIKTTYTFQVIKRKKVA